MVKIPVAKSPLAKSSMPKSPMPRSPMPKSPVPRSPVAYEKYKSRCAYGLISFFRFRHRHSKKMISDTASRSLSRHSEDDRPRHSDQYICDVVDEKTVMVDSSKAKAKRIKRDLSMEQQTKKKITTAKVENVRSDPQHSHDQSNKNKKVAKTSRGPRRLPIYGCYDVSTAQHTNSSLQIVAGRSLNSLDSIEVSKGEKDCSSKSNEINLQVNLNEATKAFINQKMIDGRHISSDESSHESKHFLDALEVLNSNKDLFVKLLQDPNSLLVKHIEDLRDSHEKEQQISSSKENIFLKDVDSQPSENIVLLKPRLNSLQHGTDSSSPDSPQFWNTQQSVKPAIFPFEQMKRKLLQAIRLRRKKQQSLMSASNGVGGNGEDIVSRNSPDEIARNLAELSKSSMNAKRKTQIGQVTEDEVVLDCERGLESSCYSPSKSPKTKRHDLYIDPRIDISELRNKNILRKQRAKTWDGISYVLDNDFLPMLSPGRAKETGFVSPQRTFSPYGKGSCLSPRQNVEASPSAVYGKQDEKTPDILNTSISSSEIETSIDKDSERTSPSGIITSESDSSHDNGVNRSNPCEEIQSLASQRKDLSMETHSNLSVDEFSSSPSNRRIFKEFDMNNENTEQPSPISVLDQFFNEDANSPINTKSQPRWQLQIGSEEVHLATHQIEVASKIDSITSTEEIGSMLNYISRVLQASHFTWDELSKKCQTSDQILGLSLFDDIHVELPQCSRDHRLLIDYVNEVVLEAYDGYLRCSPWLSFIKPSILPAFSTNGNIVNEMMKYVDPELLLAHHSETLDKIIEMDLNKSRRWMDIRLDAEDTVSEMIDDLLEELATEIAVH